jgi:hypothetical protein
MIRRFTLALLLVAAASAPSAGQVPPPRRPVVPNAWGSLSVGLFQVQEIFDPESASAWDFGNIVQFRGTLERDFQRGMSLGVAASYALAPLTYDGPDCSFCDADVPLWEALALLRIGGGGFGLHQIFELAAGITGFGAFRARDGGRLDPETMIDPTFKIAYGFGYPLSASTQFTLLQEFGLMVHRRGDRPAGDESNMPRTWATRIGLRVGLGGWR